MKTRIEFMMPNLETSIQVRSALLAGLVENKYIHFLANQETNLADLNKANAAEGSNFLHEGEKGILYGMGFGLLAGLYVLFVPSWLTSSPTWYSQSPWYIVLMVTISLGAILTAIGAALLGVNIFNTDLSKYKNRIAKGEILMIVSTDLYTIAKIRKIVKESLKMQTLIKPEKGLS
ncbi:MAG: hypothetical protein CTY14_00090 [Methylotenera sp.]|nr:MAG: hypothetical protein CTY14_00090 [Methylotenera sp.]